MATHIAADLPIFFEHQRDPEANYMTAFTGEDKGYSRARGQDVEEYILTLVADGYQ